MAIKTFTTGEVLTAADTNTYLANSGLVFVKAQTVGTAVASVTVSDAFNSTYDNYRIIYAGGTASTLTSLSLRLGASTTGYYSIVNYATYAAATTPLSAGDNNAAQFTYAGYGTTGFTQMTLDVMSPNLALNTTFGPCSWAAGTAAGTSAGHHQVSTAYTAFTILTATGTMSGGTITVYGYRKG